MKSVTKVSMWCGALARIIMGFFQWFSLVVLKFEVEAIYKDTYLQSNRKIKVALICAIVLSLSFIGMYLYDVRLYK